MHHLTLRPAAVPCALLAIQACLPASRLPDAGDSTPPRRVIVLSVDALNEARIRQSLPASATTVIRALIDSGTCALSVRPAFPSLTSPGHAALWTGAYGDVNGIAGNVQPRLPRSRRAITEAGTGFSAAALRAEPLWVAAALQGVRTAGHHATQSPAAPGAPGASTDDAAGADRVLSSVRHRGATASASPALHLVNGYDEHVALARTISHTTHPLRPAGRWEGLSRDPAGGGAVAPLEVAVPIGTRGDSLFVLVTGSRGAYTHVVASGSRSVVRGAAAWPHAVETSAAAGRELARHFSAPFDVAGNGRTLRTRVRLFELAPDGSRYLLFLPGLSVTASNHESTRRGYHAGADGWVGNSAGGLLAMGAFGRQLAAGGDGTAEQRWLETAELATRQSIAGARWMWRSLDPQLMLDYFALGDDTDHLFWGLVSSDSPYYDASVAARVQRVRAHAWSLVDLRVQAIRELARERGATVILTGDHGMRAYWRRFHPNVALARAGLLSVDDAGRIVASRSLAVSPNGYWVSVNRAAWRDGVVSPHDEAAVIDSVVRVLEAVRGPDGRPVVAAVFRAAEHDSLGVGGPVGGDVYFELAPGYYYDAAATGDVTTVLPDARGGHGFPSVSADMHTVLCMEGPAFTPRRFAQARIIDIAPTVLEWLGVPAPATMRGRSLLPLLRR